jgi:hypothetical protein
MEWVDAEREYWMSSHPLIMTLDAVRQKNQI